MKNRSGLRRTREGKDTKRRAKARRRGKNEENG